MWKSHQSGGDKLHANQLPLLGSVSRDGKPLFIYSENTLGMKGCDRNSEAYKCVYMGEE